MNAWSPFKYKAYAVLWFAGLISNIGTWVFRLVLGMADDRSQHVIILVEYKVAEEQRDRFLEVMESLGTIRKRLGALSWEITENIEEPGTYLEVIREASWEAHLRTHPRVPGDVKLLQEKLRELTVDGAEPKVIHAPAAPQPTTSTTLIR